MSKVPGENRSGILLGILDHSEKILIKVILFFNSKIRIFEEAVKITIE